MAKRLTRAERARHEEQVKARAHTVGNPTAAKPPTPRTADVRATRVGVGAELAERAAWSLVAGLAAMVGAGFALVIAGSIVTALCPADDGTCSLGWMVVIGMGVLPLQFPDGADADSLGLTGEETFDITGVTALSDTIPDTVHIKAGDIEFDAKVRIDTPGEADYYRHGGIMQYVLRQLLDRSSGA